jgi:hypothetical protein
LHDNLIQCKVKVGVAAARVCDKVFVGLQADHVWKGRHVIDKVGGKHFIQHVQIACIPGLSPPKDFGFEFL